jgi:hypothetical protein
MSRFDFDYDGEGLPWGLWETVVSNALGGRRGQAALAEMEAALVALPERKLVHGRLAVDGAVCAVGAFVAHRRAERESMDLQAVIDAMAAGVQCWCGHGRDTHTEGLCGGTHWGNHPCSCQHYEPDYSEDATETADAGAREGLAYTVAWHLAYLNDEKFRDATPEQRYEQMLGWVRRALGKESVAA